MKIAVAGIGYVGLANAIMLSRNHDVVITDILPQKVELINARTSPIEDVEIKRAFASEKLSLTAMLAEKCDYSEFDYCLVAPPTDYEEWSEKFNTTAVENVIDSAISGGGTVVVRSTVPVGFTQSMNKRYHTDRIIFAPEFLREGKALFDALHPSRIVVGGNKYYAEAFSNILAEASDKHDADILLTGSDEAEAIKLFSNAYLAMRVAFMNEIDTFAITCKLDSQCIIEGICLDPRIGSGYNNPSFGYGGYCLPKDTKQLKAAFREIPSNLISSIVDANELRKQVIANEILKIPGTIGIYRLAMKAGSDNFRESSIVHILKRLRNAERTVVVYEPLIDLSEFDGCEVCNNLNLFKARCDIIVANRIDENLGDVKNKVFSRDVFGRD